MVDVWSLGVLAYEFLVRRHRPHASRRHAPPPAATTLPPTPSDAACAPVAWQVGTPPFEAQGHHETYKKISKVQLQFTEELNSAHISEDVSRAPPHDATPHHPTRRHATPQHHTPRHATPRRSATPTASPPRLFPSLAASGPRRHTADPGWLTRAPPLPSHAPPSSWAASVAGARPDPQAAGQGLGRAAAARRGQKPPVDHEARVRLMGGRRAPGAPPLWLCSSRHPPPLRLDPRVGGSPRAVLL